MKIRMGTALRKDIMDIVAVTAHLCFCRFLTNILHYPLRTDYNKNIGITCCLPELEYYFIALDVDFVYSSVVFL